MVVHKAVNNLLSSGYEAKPDIDLEEDTYGKYCRLSLCKWELGEGKKKLFFKN